MTDRSEMKVCAFCGTPEPYALESDGHWYIACSNSDCFVAVGEATDGYGEPDYMFATKADAIAAWNTRLPTDLERQSVKALAEWLEWLTSDGCRPDAADYEEGLLAAMRSALTTAYAIQPSLAKEAP